MKKLLIIMAWALVITTATQAQITIERSVIASAGFASPTLSFTVGEAITTTATAGSIVLTQGFQQPDSVLTIGVDEMGQNPVAILLYPNPTQGLLNLRFVDSPLGNYYVGIWNLLGQQSVATTSFDGQGTLSLDASSLSAGLYYVRIVDGEQRTTLIKFQKID